MSGMGVEKAIDVESAARGQAIPETPEQFQRIKHLSLSRQDEAAGTTHLIAEIKATSRS